MGFISSSLSQKVSRGILIFLRLQLGAVFLVAAYPKISNLSAYPTQFRGALENFFIGQSHPFYRSFLESIVLPNAEIFAYIVALGEVVVGIALILGLATRLAALLAMIFMLNYMLLKGAYFWTPSSNDAAFFFMGLVLMLGAAGRAFGIDYFLAKKHPHSALW